MSNNHLFITAKILDWFAISNNVTYSCKNTERSLRQTTFSNEEIFWALRVPFLLHARKDKRAKPRQNVDSLTNVFFHPSCLDCCKRRRLPRNLSPLTQQYVQLSRHTSCDGMDPEAYVESSFFELFDHVSDSVLRLSHSQSVSWCDDNILWRCQHFYGAFRVDLCVSPGDLFPFTRACYNRK